MLSSTKKYELTEDYKRELLSWYEKVVDVMIQIIHMLESGVWKDGSHEKETADLLSKLSSLVELGRFYFPNIDKKDGFGKEKPAAYRGYRHIVLEFIMYFYEQVQVRGNRASVRVLWELERRFTSEVFQ